MSTLTFEDFQGSRKYCDDIAAVLSADMGTKSVPGMLYLGVLYIEMRPPQGWTNASVTGRYQLVLHNTDWISDDLASLEKRLYDWAVAEGYGGVDLITEDDIAKACAMDDLDEACASLQKIAGIDDGGVAGQCFAGETLTWETATNATRMALIANWLKTERNYDKFAVGNAPEQQDEKNVYDYFVESLGQPHIDATLAETCSEMPLESECGADCKLAIDRAKALTNSIIMAYGEKSAYIEVIKQMTGEVVECFVCG